MTLEIVGARLIAPYFGTSTYVWTAMIGVILGSLAFGYAIGGRLADRDNAKNSLGFIILIAATLVMVLGLLQMPVLERLAATDWDIRLNALLAALILFAAPSVLIGMVSPHLAKIRIISLETSGSSVGKLEAAGALGSIAGTFLCGYFLLGIFGSRAIIIGVVGLLLITSLLADWRRKSGLHVLIAILAIAIGVITTNINSNGVIADVDSSYARYRVVELASYGQEAVGLVTDNGGIQSAVSKAWPDRLLFSYIRAFNDALLSHPDPQSILIIGGGTYTFPEAAAKQYPGIQVDVVEIDPKLTQLAKKHFDFDEQPNLRIINEDGRTYLNNTTKKYDLIFMDAYNSLAPPFQLTTQEALEEVHRSLKQDGQLISNIIGKGDAYNDAYLQAMQATAASVFTYVDVQPANDGLALAPEENYNYILTASNQPKEQIDASALRPNALVLTDDFAPIEQLVY